MSTKLIENITIGSDFEVFFAKKGDYKKEQEEKQIISAIGLIGGKKDKPLLVKKFRVDLMMSEDNITAEVAIPYCSEFDAFRHNIEAGYEVLYEKLPIGHKISELTAASVNPKILNHPDALVFGCESDYNVYLEQDNERPQCDDPNYRSCGGHIHIGYKNPDMAVSCELAKALDLFLGVPSLFLGDDYNRRRLYGKAGSIRFKEYGLEYRSLSNFWIFDSRIQEFVWKSIFKASEYINNGNYVDFKLGEKLQTAMNEGNLVIAGEIIDQFNIELPIQKKNNKKEEFANVVNRSIDDIEIDDSLPY